VAQAFVYCDTIKVEDELIITFAQFREGGSMKRILLLIVVFVSSSLVSMASTVTCISPAAAEDSRLQNVGNVLASPTSSERFFKEGQQQLEREIQRLQQGSNAQISDILKIDPAIFQQLQNLQQQEQHPLDGVREPQNRILPSELLRE
jgi:hypothetical protein